MDRQFETCMNCGERGYSVVGGFCLGGDCAAAYSAKAAGRSFGEHGMKLKILESRLEHVELGITELTRAFNEATTRYWEALPGGDIVERSDSGNGCHETGDAGCTDKGD